MPAETPMKTFETAFGASSLRTDAAAVEKAIDTYAGCRRRAGRAPRAAPRNCRSARGDDVARRKQPQRQQHDRPAVGARKQQRHHRGHLNREISLSTPLLSARFFISFMTSLAPVRFSSASSLTTVTPSTISLLASLTPQFTLWSQEGSSVLRGNVIITPVGNSLL